MEHFAVALEKQKVPYDGVHGLSLYDETTAGNTSYVNTDCKIWFDLASNWLKKYFE